MSLGLKKKRLFSPQGPVGGSVPVFPHHTHAPPTLPSVEPAQVVSGAGVLIEKTTPRPTCSLTSALCLTAGCDPPVQLSLPLVVFRLGSQLWGSVPAGKLLSIYSFLSGFQEPPLTNSSPSKGSRSGVRTTA